MQLFIFMETGIYFQDPLFKKKIQVQVQNKSIYLEYKYLVKSWMSLALLLINLMSMLNKSITLKQKTDPTFYQQCILHNYFIHFNEFHDA